MASWAEEGGISSGEEVSEILLPGAAWGWLSAGGGEFSGVLASVC